MKFDRLNDGSNNPPRLRIQQTWWGMTRLPFNSTPESEWSTAEKIAKIQSAGFEGLEAWLGPDNEAEVSAEVKKHGLRL
jgi:hypothetical protein